MNRVQALVLVTLAVVGGVAGFILEFGLASAGQPIVSLPLSLSITLVAAAAIVVLLAVPISRAIKGTNQKPVNPFRALRIAVLAQASSLCGALIAGFGLGVVSYLLSRAVVSSLASLWLDGATALAGVILMVAGLIAEKLCTLPPNDPELK